MQQPIIIATDGSSLGNPGPGGWAWVATKDRWAAGGLPKATNQVAELFAVLAALRTIPTHIPVAFHVDSQYVLKTCTAWIPVWKENEWRKSDGKIIANLSLIQEIDRLLTKRRAPVTFTWVRGHNGHALNETADKLCTAASNAVRSGKPVTTGPGWNGNGSPALPGGHVNQGNPDRAAGRSKPANSVSGRQAQPTRGTAKPTTSRKKTDTSMTTGGPIRTRIKPVADPATRARERVIKQEDRFAGLTRPPRVRAQPGYTAPAPTPSPASNSTGKPGTPGKPGTVRQMSTEPRFCPACNGPINPVTYECRCSD